MCAMFPMLYFGHDANCYRSQTLNAVGPCHIMPNLHNLCRVGWGISEQKKKKLMSVEN